MCINVAFDACTVCALVAVVHNYFLYITVQKVCTVHAPNAFGKI